MKIETLRWVGDHLEMIDQRILPLKFNYLSYFSASDVAEGIKTMVVRGAPAIGVAAAYGIALEAKANDFLSKDLFLGHMASSFSNLAASRPTAVNLFWALKKMQTLLDQTVHTQSVTAVANNLLLLAHQIRDDDIAINLRMGVFGAKLLPDEAVVLTHCNAGALATAGHGTALGVVRSAVQMGKKISVIADETRPFLQGARLTSWEMIQEGIPVTLITDNMSGHLMKAGDIDAIIVGTDRVAANGDVANKIGTYMVAVLAKRHSIPFYVACPLSTIDLSVACGEEIPIEERNSSEVTGFGELQWAPDGVRVRNPSFDVTPAELVSALITEEGVVFEPNAAKIKALIEHESE
jgi:methylthioribose-1-phosphate isomerase